MKLNPYNKAHINDLIFGNGGGSSCSRNDDATLSPLIQRYDECNTFDADREKKTQENIRRNEKEKKKREKDEEYWEKNKNIGLSLKEINGKGCNSSKVEIDEEHSITPPPSPKEKSPKEIKEECIKKLRQVAQEVKQVRKKKQDYTEKVFNEIERVRKILDIRHEYMDTHNVKNDYIEKTNRYIYRFIELINTQR
jgi:hypothetical protein